MNILYILPRDMHFGSTCATSIDLCCRDLITYSAYRQSTRVLASPIDDWYSGFDIQPFPSAADRSTRARIAFAADYARHVKPDLIVVQQHLAPAAGIAAVVKIPVILHRHNFQRAYPAGSFLGRIRHNRKRRSYQMLAGMMHVSEACEKQFRADWPDVTIPQTAVPNGIAMASWHPAKERAAEILCVSRSAPEKGILETAQALATVLPEVPDWKGRLILSAVSSHPQYHAEVLEALAPVASRVVVETQRPYSEVQAAYERAAIAVVPSKWEEPLGRTALEAHAGGAALISSGTGGLREISGNTAFYTNEVTSQALADAMRQLIQNTPRREELGAVGRQRVEHLYTTDIVSSQADAFFRKILDGSRHSAEAVREGAIA